MFIFGLSLHASSNSEPGSVSGSVTVSVVSRRAGVEQGAEAAGHIISQDLICQAAQRHEDHTHSALTLSRSPELTLHVTCSVIRGDESGTG